MLHDETCTFVLIYLKLTFQLSIIQISILFIAFDLDTILDLIYNCFII